MSPLSSQEWVPCTKLGRLVRDGKIKSLEQMYTYFEKITGGDFGAALSASEGGQPALA